MKIFGKKCKFSFGVIQVLMFASFFLTLINGEIGWIIIYAFAAAHIISVVLTVISTKNVRVEIKPDFAGVHEKNEPFTVEVMFAKAGFCLLPDIYFEVYDNTNGLKYYCARTALIGRKSVTVSLNLTSQICGLDTIACTEWCATDLFGFITAKTPVNLRTAAAILPELKKFEGKAPVPKLIPDDDEEHENSAVNSFFGGTPGYEYRDYEAGDSPRKINYKLSAKRRRLMVRRDESTVSGTTRILIRQNSGGGYAEQAFAAANEVIRLGGAAEVFHCGKSFFAASPAELEKLREWLAFRNYAVTSGDNDYDDEKLLDNMDYVFGCDKDPDLEDFFKDRNSSN